MRLFRGTAINLLLLAGSVAGAVALAEWVAGEVDQDPAARIAAKRGDPFDSRSRFEVILGCRQERAACFPTVPPNTFLKAPLMIEGSRTIPLSGVPEARTVGCNEAGYYSTFVTDEYGFRNPVGSWRDSAVVDLAFVGDSYTQGDCVGDGDTFVDHFRESFPKVLNLGAGGNGPLLELAAIREYLERRQVRRLFWVYFERNDLSDLERDKRAALLLEYLRPDFAQELEERQSVVGEAVRLFVEQRLRDELDRRPMLFPKIRSLLWKVRNSREGGPVNADLLDARRPQYDIDLFRQILDQAKQAAEKSGGRLAFVYLPEYERFDPDTPSPPWSGAAVKPMVVDMVTSLGIDIIDVEAAFRAVDDPLALFPFRRQGHYNREGYAIVAKAITRYLNGTGMPNAAMAKQ